MSVSLQRRVQECLDRAQRCEDHARATNDELIREQFLATAQEWRKLANAADQFVKRGYNEAP